MDDDLAADRFRGSFSNKSQFVSKKQKEKQVQFLARCVAPKKQASELNQAADTSDRDRSSDSDSEGPGVGSDPSLVSDVVVDLATDDDDDDQTPQFSWSDGRRVVQLDVLAEGLRGCQVCHKPLHLHNTVGEQHFGLASHLYIKCMNCDLTNSVPTGTRQGRRPFDVNIKLAAGTLHSGIGPEQLNKLLASLNICPIHHKQLKKWERCVGACVEEVATSSCVEAQNEEATQTASQSQIDSSTTTSEDNREGQEELGGEEKEEEGTEESTASSLTQLTIAYDAGWQKRGTGRQYNSLTGHGSFIGEKTGKVLMYSVMCKTCRVCDYAKKRGTLPRAHACRRNWLGSSKAMEPAMAVEMLKKLKNTGSSVGTLVMDGDSTTIARVQKEVDLHLKKKTDENHLKKGLIGALYHLSSKHATLKSTPVRNYIVRCVMYAIKQNQSKPSAIVSNLTSVVPHLFGDHRLCNPRWCHHSVQGSSFRYRSLPHGKPLQGNELQKDLQILLDRYIRQSDMLSRLGSTQACESFNSMVAAKAPKARFYGGSDSLNFRVSCTVAQKNLGYCYLTEVNERLGISPGCYTKLHALRLEKKRQAQHNKESSREGKKLRVKRKQEQTSHDSAAAICEGDTYRSGVESTLSDVQPSLESIQMPRPSDTLVFVDLETTGLSRTSDITQLAAVCGIRQFSKYIMPVKDITPGASQTTGLVVRNSRMYKDDVEVVTTTLHVALTAFLDFIEQCSCPPVLVGHNIASYDAPVLLHSLKQCSMVAAVHKATAGCLDTLQLARKKFPKPHGQEHLVKTLLGKEYAAHDALGDVLALKELYETQLKLTTGEMAKHVFDLLASYHRSSLDALVSERTVSKNMSIKLARNGLGLRALKLAYQRDSDSGVRVLLSQLVSGKPRVTRNTKIVEKICDYLSKH